jgi:hypothetical protein
MIYDSPNWSWKAAYEPMEYGFVHNDVLVSSISGKERTGFVHVPTELFQILGAVFTKIEYGVAYREGVHFYLDEQTKDHWIFGFETCDSSIHRDLWFYTKSTLPKWAELVISKM